MPFASSIHPASVIGRAPERLTIEERTQLAGKFIALQVYDPKTLPLRRIEAIAEAPQDCIRQLTARGLDPRHFELQRLLPPY
jgi:hypothetical protein